MRPELGEHDFNPVDGVAEAGGDGLPGPFGSAGAEWSRSPGEPSGVAQLRNDHAALVVEVLDAPDIVIVVRGVELGVEVG